MTTTGGFSYQDLSGQVPSWQTGGTQGTGAASGVPGNSTIPGFDSPYQDQITTTEGTRFNRAAYNQSESYPKLPPPQHQQPGATPPPPPSANTLGTVFSQNLFDEFQSLLHNGSITQGEAGQFIRALFNPNEQVPQNIRDLVNKIIQQANQDQQKQFPGSPQQTPSTDQYNTMVQKQYVANFQSELQKSGLTPEQIAKLTAAFYNPELADADTTNLLQNILKNASTQLQTQLGVPPGTQLSPNATQFNLDLSASYSLAFENLLNNYPQADELTQGGLTAFSKANKLTPQQTVGYLRYLFNHSSSTFPGSQQLLPLLQMLQKQASGPISAQNGYPSDWAPNVNSRQYDNVVWKTYQNLKSQGMSEKDALSTIQNQFALPPTVQPTPPPVKTGNYVPFVGQTQVNNAIKTVNDTYVVMVNVAQSVPQNANTANYGNFLYTVGLALSNLESQVYAMEAADSNSSKIASESQMQMQQTKIQAQIAEQQQILAEQAKANSGKMHDFQNVMKSLSPVMQALMYIGAFIAGGPLMVVFVVLDQKFGLINSVFNDLNNALNTALAKAFPNSPDLQKALSFVTQAAVLMAACYVALSAGGGQSAMQIFMTGIQESGLLMEFAGLFTDNPETAAIIAASIMAAIAITTFIVSLCVPGAQEEAVAELPEVGDATIEATEAGEVAGQTAENVASTTEDIASTTTDITEDVSTQTFSQQFWEKMDSFGDWAKDFLMNNSKYFNIGWTGLNAAASGLQGGASIVTAMQDFSMADIAKIKAKFEAQIEMLQAMIKAIQKLLKNMMDGLQSLGQWVDDINTLQGKKYTDIEQSVRYSHA
jgi:hypothetical protein